MHALLALPGLLLWALDSLALTLLLGGFCARFRDIMPIVNSVMQIAFFITPVIWKPEQLGPAGMSKLPFNPFYDLLEIVRAPLLGHMPSMMVWSGALGYSIVLCALSVGCSSPAPAPAWPTGSDAVGLAHIAVEGVSLSIPALSRQFAQPEEDGGRRRLRAARQRHPHTAWWCRRCATSPSRSTAATGWA